MLTSFVTHGSRFDVDPDPSVACSEAISACWEMRIANFELHRVTYTLQMPIDIDIAHVARLARLGLSDEELSNYQAQLGVILEHAAHVQELDTDGVEPTAHPLPMVNAFRADEVRPSLDRDEVLAQSPEHDDGYFRVPPHLETQ